MYDFYSSDDDSDDEEKTKTNSCVLVWEVSFYLPK